jgi:hypothetical protein
MERIIPIILQRGERCDIGADTITGINDADEIPPFPLTAKFDKLTICNDVWRECDETSCIGCRDSARPRDRIGGGNL